MKSSVLHKLIDTNADKQAVALVTNLDDDTQVLIYRHALTDQNQLELAVKDAFRRDRSQVVEIDGSRQFIQVYNSPLRLMIVGAVHIARPLTEMSQACGCLLYTSPSPRDRTRSRMPSSA